MSNTTAQAAKASRTQGWPYDLRVPPGSTRPVATWALEAAKTFADDAPGEESLFRAKDCEFLEKMTSHILRVTDRQAAYVCDLARHAIIKLKISAEEFWADVAKHADRPKKRDAGKAANFRKPSLLAIFGDQDLTRGEASVLAVLVKCSSPQTDSFSGHTIEQLSWMAKLHKTNFCRNLKTLEKKLPEITRANLTKGGLNKLTKYAGVLLAVATRYGKKAAATDTQDESVAHGATDTQDETVARGATDTHKRNCSAMRYTPYTLDDDSEGPSKEGKDDDSHARKAAREANNSSFDSDAGKKDPDSEGSDEEGEASRPSSDATSESTSQPDDPRHDQLVRRRLRWMFEDSNDVRLDLWAAVHARWRIGDRARPLEDFEPNDADREWAQERVEKIKQAREDAFQWYYGAEPEYADEEEWQIKCDEQDRGWGRVKYQRPTTWREFEHQTYWSFMYVPKEDHQAAVQAGYKNPAYDLDAMTEGFGFEDQFETVEASLEKFIYTVENSEFPGEASALQRLNRWLKNEREDVSESFP